MKTTNNIPNRSAFMIGLTLVTASVAFAADPATSASKAGNNAADRASSKIEDYRSESTDVNKAEVKAALAQIDAELEHLDNLIDSAPTKAEKNETKARYDALKERRDQLKKEFTQARYDSLKHDVRAEVDRVSNWAKQTFSRQPAASAAAGATSDSANKAADKINDYRTDASDLNKAEVKAALAKLDADIDLLAAKIDAVSNPESKAQLKARLGDLKERRKELNSDFRKARYDALVADVKGEWNRLTD